MLSQTQRQSLGKYLERCITREMVNTLEIGERVESAIEITNEIRAREDGDKEPYGPSFAKVILTWCEEAKLGRYFAILR